MSAQLLLSVIAPAAPAAPQGTADADASGFKGLLSTMLEAANDADAALEKGAPAPKARDDESKDAAAFLTAPAGLPTPQTVPVLIVANPTPPATGDSADASSEAAPVQAAPEASLPVGDEAVPPPTAAPGTDVAPLTVPTLDAGKTADGAKPMAKTDQPLIQPAAPTTTSGLAATAPVDAAPIDAAKAQDAARAVAALEAVAKGAPAPVATPAVAVVAPSPAPAAPPLRPLAERTRLSADVPTNAAAGPASASEAAPAAPVSSAPLASAAGATGADQPVAHAGPAAVVAREILPTEVPADDAASPAPAPLDGGPVTQQAHATAHDVALSQTSRASIDATAQIAAQIVRKLEGRSTRFEMALTPDDLGRVDVKLDIDSEGRLAARLAFDNPLAATDLKGRADELRRQLQDAGFQLSDNALEFADRDSSSSAFDRGGDARHGQNRAFAAASRLNAETDVVQPARWTALNLSPTGVDLKV